MNYLQDLEVISMYQVKPGDVVSTEWASVVTQETRARAPSVSAAHYSEIVRETVELVPLTQVFKEVEEVYDHPVSAETTIRFLDKSSMRYECIRKVIKLSPVGADMFKELP